MEKQVIFRLPIGVLRLSLGVFRSCKKLFLVFTVLSMAFYVKTIKQRQFYAFIESQK